MAGTAEAVAASQAQVNAVRQVCCAWVGMSAKKGIPRYTLFWTPISFVLEAALGKNHSNRDKPFLHLAAYFSAGCYRTSTARKHAFGSRSYSTTSCAARFSKFRVRTSQDFWTLEKHLRDQRDKKFEKIAQIQCKHQTDSDTSLK